jgi:DNA polymerase-3 subunit delta'
MAWNLIGHSWAENMLQQHVNNHTLRHAYLFTGPQGVGRRSLALAFARAINCLQPASAGVPCDECRACQQIGRMQHPDLSIVQVEEEHDVILVDQIRELQHTLSLAPYEAKYRIALLLNFEQANDNAQNALLKTLEEPNERVILLLTATLAENLLPTIASRCEILQLRPTSLQELSRALMESEKLEQDKAELLAHIAGGRVGYAFHLCREPELLARRASWLEDLLHLLGASRRERLAYAEAKAPSRAERTEIREVLREAYEFWCSFWRDVLLTGSRADVPISNLDYAEVVHHLAQQVNPENSSVLIRRLEHALQRLGNANLRLLTEALLLEWPHLEIA